MPNEATDLRPRLHLRRGVRAGGGRSDEMTDETTLLPCPFCGGEARAVVTIEPEYRSLDVLHVKCLECGAKGSESMDSCAAIEAWNRRCMEDDLK